VIWSRILTPEGVSVDVGSPGTDPLGRGGLSGETDSHFFQRFGGAILLSVLTAGVEAAANQGGGTSVIIGSPSQAAGLAAVAPQNTANIPVTVKVMQGSPLQVFLVRDLDFSGVAAAGSMKDGR
jgi:type IV secretory pathway VirB10-like protein